MAIARRSSPTPTGKPVAGRGVHLELQKMTLRFGDARSRGRRKRAAVDEVRYRCDGRRHLGRATRSRVTSHAAVTRAVSRARKLRRCARAMRARPTFKSSPSERARPIGGISDPNAVAVEARQESSTRSATRRRALVASPYARADVYFSVVRNDAIYRTTLRNVTRRGTRQLQGHAADAAQCGGRSRRRARGAGCR